MIHECMHAPGVQNCLTILVISNSQWVFLGGYFLKEKYYSKGDEKLSFKHIPNQCVIPKLFTKDA